MRDDPKDWIKVAALPALGAGVLKKLWEQGWTPQALLNADPTTWQGLGLKQKTIAELIALQQQKQSPTAEKITQALHWRENCPDAHIIAITDADYPVLLREIPDPPPVLFVRGNLAALNLPQVAIVGSRHASASGLRHAHDFAAFLSQCGVVITSGMALGIDAAAHQGCLDVSGITVAVFGAGIDRIYPASHRRLALEVLAHKGALVSELFPSTPPLPNHFPRRNRIISGLSAGVLVVEAALKSGSLITARLALEQNRNVYALPGPLSNPMSKGCHKLIKDGAYLVEEGKDIIAEMGEILGVFQQQLDVEGGEVKKTLTEPLSSSEAKVLEIIGFEPINLDLLCAKSGMSMAELSDVTVGLELKGAITQMAGGYLRL